MLVWTLNNSEFYVISNIFEIFVFQQHHVFSYIIKLCILK